MSSQRLLKEVETHGMEETMSEALDGTTKDPSGDLSGGLSDVLDPDDDTFTKDDKEGEYHASKKAKMTHDEILSSEASSNNTSNANSDTVSNSIHSSDSRDANIPQSSYSSTSPEKGSSGHQIATAPEAHSAQTPQGLSDYYKTSDNESPSPPTSAKSHAKYRKSGPSLMTLHMFTGGFRGKRPAYVPVYKRDSDGKLFKLVKDWSGRWEYTELDQLTEQEAEEGLKLLEEPKAEVKLQESEPEKTVGRRRTLADFGLPETKPQGGWGWL